MTTGGSPTGSGRWRVAVLGATGSVGQRLLTLLDGHPWFTVTALTASERSAGKPYADAVEWVLPTPIPEAVRGLVVGSTRPPLDVDVVFSALDSSVAGDAETAFARAGHRVVSNARNHRMDPGVPLLVPEVNPEHLALTDEQDFGGGCIVTNPNCSTIGLALTLAPLHRAFGVERAHVVTLQAVSGAGYPGVSSLRAMDNVVPFIGGEEDKLETEPRKILGVLEGSSIRQADIHVSAACNRVPVVDGHTLCVSVTLGRDPSADDIRAAWEGFRGPPEVASLPSAPARPVVYLDGDADPQPRLHRDLGGGMSSGVGRLRRCPLLGWKYVTVSHNTVRGAAGGALLCAELLAARGSRAGRP